jgi:hypothetical protein
VSVASTSLPEQYQDLSAELGLCPGDMLTLQIKNFMIEQQIPMYDYSSVVDYMRRVAAKERKKFFWRPLRKKDKDVWGTWEWNVSQSGEWNVRQSDDYYRRFECSVYDKMVPLHILQDVKLLDKKFDGKVGFFVTDYAVPRPDPFILVSAPQESAERIIFGAWDEPGFGVI